MAAYKTHPAHKQRKNVRVSNKIQIKLLFHHHIICQKYLLGYFDGPKFFLNFQFVPPKILIAIDTVTAWLTHFYI